MKDPIAILRMLFNMLIALCLVVVFMFVGVLLIKGNPEWFASLGQKSKEPSVTAKLALEIEEGVHVPTGLVDGPGLNMVIRHCTGCHSAKLITQNKATANGWRNTIAWMQETQGLWDLAESEDTIVNYLATFYAPEEEGRRKNLPDQEWYELN